MKLALVGTGLMGQAVEQVAIDRGHEIVARYDETNPVSGIQDPASAGIGRADVVVDFTLPSVVVGHIERYCRWNLRAVVGTTGWYGELDRVREWVGRSEGALLYAPNFSIGVALLRRALQAMVPLLERFPEYDPYVHEVHHVRKVDSPSGTALMLADVFVQGLTRKERVETETRHSRIDASALHVTSTRAGQVFGHHTIGLDSAFDHIELTHDAKDRRGFAFGAVRSAEWLLGRRGLFTLDDVLSSEST